MSLHQNIFRAFLTNAINEKEAFALLQIVNGKPLMTEILELNSTEAKLGMTAGFATIDAEGFPLVCGKVYRKLNGNKVKVLREMFGSGNIMDTYYYIYVLNTDLEEERILVEGQLQKDYSTLYQSDLTSVK